MSPIETEKFITDMKMSFRRQVDDEWRGPIYGPGGPHMSRVPDPSPWHELAVAHQFVSLADSLELASEGLGVSMLKRFAEEPLDPCGTRPPGWPFPPKGEEPILNLTVLGAALVFVGEGAGSEAVGKVAQEAGRGMIG